MVSTIFFVSESELSSFQNGVFRQAGSQTGVWEPEINFLIDKHPWPRYLNVAIKFCEHTSRAGSRALNIKIWGKYGQKVWILGSKAVRINNK